MLRLVSIAFMGLTLGLAGCLQGVGDRCQVTGDCQDDLVCVLPPGATAVTGGMCEKQATSDAGAVPVDFQAAPDMQSAPDLTAAAPDDLSTED